MLFFYVKKKVFLTYAVTGGWDLLIGWLLHLRPYDPVLKRNDYLALSMHLQGASDTIFSVQDTYMNTKMLFCILSPRHPLKD